MRKILAAMSLAAMLGTAIAPAFAADAELVAAAKAEGVVTWYTSLIQDQAVRPMVAAFEAAYPGVRVDVVGGTVGDLLTKINSELDANQLQADVHHGGSVVDRLMSRDAIAAYLPETVANIPDDLKDPDQHWAAQVISYLVPAYNTDLVSAEDAPKSLEDLLDPRWKGKIAWTNGMTQGGPAGFIGMVLTSMGQDAGMDYLRKLSEQDIVNVPANQRVVLDQAVQGEYPVVLQVFSHHVEISAAQGAPVAWIPMEPAVMTTLDAGFMMKAAPHPNAAKLFLDFLFSDAGQQVLAKANYIPANPAMRVNPITAKAVAITPKMTAKSLQDWIAIYNELFK